MLTDPRDQILNVTMGKREVTVRAAREDELDEVFALRYRVYVEEMHLLRPEQLPAEQVDSARKWDDFDFADTTRHLVAVHEERVVACVRLVDDLDGCVPLDRNGFSLEPVRRQGQRVREVGKLVVSREFRGLTVCRALFALTWLYCRVIDPVEEIYLSCEARLERLYRELNAQHIGTFWNREFGRTYSVMRIPALDTFAEQCHASYSSQDR